MPPKKEAKEKQIKGDEAEELVLQYLKSVNRPYASTDVSANLKNKVPKAAAQKILTSLAEKGSLTCKMYGKQSIFVYNQARLSVASSDELSVLEAECKSIKQDLEEKRKQLKILQADLGVKTQAPKTKELGVAIERAKLENAVTLNAIMAFRGDKNDDGPKIEPLTAEEIKKIDEQFTRWRKEWVERRKVYKEALGMLQDAGQVDSTPAFEDAQGIYPDEEDAKEVEQGEFCKPPTVNRSRTFVKSALSSLKAVAADSGIGGKRSVSTGTAGSVTSGCATESPVSSQGPPKKKGKK